MEPVEKETCGVKVVPTLVEHLPYLWEIIKEHGTEKFFPDHSRPGSLKGFLSWWRLNATGTSLTGLYNGEPIGVGFLYSVYQGKTASINIWKKRGFLNTAVIAQIMYDAIPLLYDSADLHKITGIVRINNHACIKLFRLIGFQIDGVIRHHDKVGGRWQDYYLVSMLRSEWESRARRIERRILIWVAQKKARLTKRRRKKSRLKMKKPCLRLRPKKGVC